jgi:hypothetical protein
VQKLDAGERFAATRRLPTYWLAGARSLGNARRGRGRGDAAALPSRNCGESRRHPGQRCRDQLACSTGRRRDQPCWRHIIDARIHTTDDGMALDNFLVQDMGRAPFADPHQIKRLEAAVGKALEGQEPSADRLAARALPLRRAEAFAIQPAVFVNNQASRRYTVIEVNARDRAALLFE